MKRMIKSTSNKSLDKLGVCLADINDVMVDYFEQLGFDKKEASENYWVTVKNGDNSDCKNITVSADLGYYEFHSRIVPYLNEAVQKIDKDAYFDAYDANTWVCTLWLENRPSDDDEFANDPLFNHKNVEYICQYALDMVSDKFEQEFTLDECEAYRDLRDDDIVRIAMFAHSDDYETKAYADVITSETFSKNQMKQDTVEELYSRLINNMQSK